MFAEDSRVMGPDGHQRYPVAVRMASFVRRAIERVDFPRTRTPDPETPASDIFAEEVQPKSRFWNYVLVAAVAFSIGAVIDFVLTAASGGNAVDVSRDATLVPIPIFAIVAVLTFVVTIVIFAFKQVKLITDKLQTSEEQYDLVAAAINGGLWHWNIAKNEEYYSPHWMAILGYAPDDLTEGEAVSDIHPEDSVRARQALRDHLENKVPYDIEIRLHHRDGEYVWVHSTGQAVWDEDGTPLRMAGSITEITQIMRAETAFRESQDQMRAISDNTPSLMYMKDTESRLIMVNRAFQSFYNATEEEALGEDMGKWLSPDNAELFFELDKKVLTTGKPQETRFEVLRHDGKSRPMQSTEFPVFDHQRNIIGIGGIDTDIFERKRAEDSLLIAMDAAESANHAKSEFMANMSHELRTPLNAIIGFSEIMAGEIFGPVGSPQYRGYAKDINASGTHLLEIINNMLDLSKIEANKFDLQEQTVDVPHAVQACVTLVQGRAEKQGVKIQAVVSDKSPYLYCDERGLKQVLLNLMTNAVKFTPEGGTLTVETWSNETDGFVFRFRDTGIGIATEDIPMVLTPFGQVESAHSRLQQGTGLGLPLTKSIVELHGGTFELQSEVEVGTTVTVSFPARRVVAELAATGT